MTQKFRAFNHKTFLQIGFLVMVLMSGAFVLEAATQEELNQQISSHQDSIASLEAEIKDYQNKLVDVGTEKQSLQKQLSQLSLSQKKLEAETALTNKKIAATRSTITELGNSIGSTSETITQSERATKQSISLLNEYESMSIVERLAGTSNLGDVWQGIDENARVRETLVAHINDLKNTRLTLLTNKTKVEEEQATLKGLNDKLADQKKVVLENKKEQQTLLSETQNKESTFKKVIADKEALRTAYENELRQYESDLKYILDPSSLPRSGSSPLAWPLEDVYVTQLFGKTISAVRLYASGTHSGWDFRADIGTPVYALGDGIVLGTGDTDIACKGASFGKWVYVRYNNGLGSTFGHLSVIKAVTGQTVKATDVVAYSGFTGHATAPHLHVTVYAADAVQIAGKESVACKGKILVQPRAAVNAYLDPGLYFPKPTSAMLKPGSGYASALD